MPADKWHRKPRFTEAEKLRIEDMAFYRYVITSLSDDIWKRRTRAWKDVVK